MTTSATPPDSRIEGIRRLGSLVAVGIIVAAIVAGLTFSMAGQRQASVTAYTIAVVLMLLMPVTGMIAVLFTEIRRRDWWFAAAALAVLLLIAYRVLGFFRLIGDRVFELFR